jgi:hypothetical protein
MLDLAAAGVGAEWIGRARDFRNRVAAENDRYLEASWRMVEPISARLKRFPTRCLRDAMMRDFERQWRQHMPQEFSVDLTTEWRRHGVTITERRIAAAEFHDDGWRDGYSEPEVSLGDVMVELGRAVARVTFHTRAIVSLHALTERYRHGWEIDDAALISDIVVLGAFDVATIAEGQHVTIPVTGGAGWRARAVRALINDERTERVIAVGDWWN